MQEVIEQDSFSVYEKCKKKENNTGTETERNALKLRSAKQDGTYLVSNGILTTLMKLEIVRKSICQKSDSVDMDHHPFLLSHLRLWAKKLQEYVLKILLSVLYKIFNDLGLKRTDVRHCKLQVPASAYCTGYLLYF